MKLALVRQRYTPFGGAERIVARVLPMLEQNGVDVTLIARRAQGWGARRVLRVDPFYLGRLWRDASFARAARRAWLREGFDLVQSHERIPGCDVFRAGDGVHRRWLELRRKSGGIFERLGMALNPYHRYVCRAEKAMFEHPRLRAVICNSEMVREEIRRGFRVSPGKLHVVYNGVDLEHFDPRGGEQLRTETRAALGCLARDFVFLFVGSGFARKGLDTAIAALAAARRDDFLLLVAGQDREAQRYRRAAHSARVGERVRFLGAVEDVRPLYLAADCFILPSRYDPFPNSALEALAMGLPAIVSARCGAAEIIEPGKNGWICEAEDSLALSRLMRTAGEPHRRNDMARAARASVERFGIGAMAEKLGALYASL